MRDKLAGSFDTKPVLGFKLLTTEGHHFYQSQVELIRRTVATEKVKEIVLINLLSMSVDIGPEMSLDSLIEPAHVMIDTKNKDQSSIIYLTFQD